jgi:hypothetical protein
MVALVSLDTVMQVDSVQITKTSGRDPQPVHQLRQSYLTRKPVRGTAPLTPGFDVFSRRCGEEAALQEAEEAVECHVARRLGRRHGGMVRVATAMSEDEEGWL